MQSSPNEPGFALPKVIEPPDTVCFQIPVPNDPAYLQAFFGVIYDLTLWISWQRDAAHTGVKAAARMKQVYNALAAGLLTCDTSALNFDGEELMASLCESLRWHDGKLQALCCGAWVDIPGFEGVVAGGATQPPPGGVLSPGECQSFSAVLQGSGQFLLPNPVQAGYTIVVDGASGGWTDGSGSWYCPDGSQYVLGGCNPAGKHHIGGDPSATAYHMQLIALINGIYYPINGPTTINVPAGTPASQVTFQANDASLTDNGGSINFQVQVCAPQSGGNSVAVCYPAGGTGPATVQFGVPFNVSSSPNPNTHDVITMGFPVDVTLTILSEGTWQERITNGDTVYATNTGQNSCDINHIFAGTIVTVPNGHLPLQLRTSGVYIDSQKTGWTMQFRIDP